MVELEFQQKTKTLIDSLKSICANYGLGNDGNEFKIITQTFLYKFLNDKFAFEAKKLDDTIAKADKWEEALVAMSEDDLDMLQLQMGGDTARLKPQHFISYLFSQQNAPDFAKLFDDTLIDIAISNNDVFAVKTDGGAKVVLFDRISQYIADDSKRDAFCRAIINKLVEFSFERIFTQKFDFYATIFEYLIKDYNSNSGGKYAEYFTPHAVARIMAEILVPKEQRGTVRNVACYDPSAGSGTLLMNVAHAIGENRCSIYTQDISQKSSNLLRLNLILNNLVHSIPNVIQGNTVLHPYHKDGKELKRFDYIVSNPPFKLDFSDFRDELDSKENKERFFAGIPKIKAILIVEPLLEIPGKIAIAWIRPNTNAFLKLTVLILLFVSSVRYNNKAVIKNITPTKIKLFENKILIFCWNRIPTIIEGIIEIAIFNAKRVLSSFFNLNNEDSISNISFLNTNIVLKAVPRCKTSVNNKLS